MLSNLRLIFIHGINEQTTNYSQKLYLKVLAACRTQLQLQGHESSAIDEILQKVVQHEVLWADFTTDLINRYIQLEYEQKSRLFWRFLTRPVDPLGIQIMTYIKDKGDKTSGAMTILKEVDNDMKRILAEDDVGKDDASKKNKNAIIIAHSLGSVIAFDYVMCFRNECSLDKNVTIKSFITMGSPLPLFTSAMGHPDSELELPPHVVKWVNIMSPKDGVARYMKPFFRKIPIEEHKVSTGFFPLQAHGGYWKNKGTASIIAKEVLIALGFAPK